MKNNIVLYLPTDDSKAIEEYSTILCRAFGGCTIIPGCKGAWLDDSGKLVRDSITLLKCFTDKDKVLDSDINELVNYIPFSSHIACRAKREFNQDCVSLEINGELLFI